MTDETYKKILKAIDTCNWKKDIGDGIYICRGEVLPCNKVIDIGKCPVIREIMEKET